MPIQISGFSVKIIIVFCQKLLQVELPVAENSFNFVDNVIWVPITVFHGPTQLSPQSHLTLQCTCPISWHLGISFRAFLFVRLLKFSRCRIDSRLKNKVYHVEIAFFFRILRFLLLSLRGMSTRS